MKYTKKPVTVEAMQLVDIESAHAIAEWSKGAARYDFDVYISEPVLRIGTLEGEMRASLNDWVIKGVQGEFYPCKPNIFAATYEPEYVAPPVDGPAPVEPAIVTADSPEIQG